MDWQTKLTSRKFILAMATGLLVVLNDGLGLGIPEDALLKLVGIVGIWIFGESWIDAASVKKNGG